MNNEFKEMTSSRNYNKPATRVLTATYRFLKGLFKVICAAVTTNYKLVYYCSERGSVSLSSLNFSYFVMYELLFFVTYGIP